MQNTCGEYHLVCYICVRGAWSHMKPSESQRYGRSGVWAQGGEGVIVRHDLSCRTGEGQNKVRREKSRQLRPVCPPFIAKANPTPASKLAFMVWQRRKSITTTTIHHHTTTSPHHDITTSPHHRSREVKRVGTWNEEGNEVSREVNELMDCAVRMRLVI